MAAARRQKSTAVELLNTLISQVAGGDATAMAALRAATFVKLRSVVSTILSDRQDCEDVLQDVFVTVWLRAGSYDAGINSPISWLAAIARNRAIDRWRAQVFTRRWVALDEAMHVPDVDPLPSESLETRDQWRVVGACLDRMDARSAEAVRMAVLEGVSQRDVAEHFSVGPSTMKSIIRRALINLRSQLDGPDSHETRRVHSGEID